MRAVLRELRFLCFALLPLTSLLLAVCCADAFPQDDTTSDDEVVRIRTDLVTVPLFVTDRRGQRVAGLTQADFVVRDGGQPVNIEYFTAGTERVALAFALDESGSVRDHIVRQRETALALFSRFGAGSRVAVLRFGEKAELAVPLTTRSDEAHSAFRFPELYSTRTAIFDAAVAAVRAFDGRGGDRAERRIVILISDGLDTASRAKASAAITEASLRAVSIYVIHLPIYAPRDGRLAPRPASKGFREMAEKTGGRYFLVGDVRAALDPRATYDLAPVFNAIEEDLRSQYVLGYYLDGATAPGNRPRRVEIDLTSNKTRGLRVRSLREDYTLKQ